MNAVISETVCNEDKHMFQSTDNIDQAFKHVEQICVHGGGIDNSKFYDLRYLYNAPDSLCTNLRHDYDITCKHSVSVSLECNFCLQESCGNIVPQQVVYGQVNDNVYSENVWVFIKDSLYYTFIEHVYEEHKVQRPLSANRASHIDTRRGNITNDTFRVTISFTNHSLWKHSQQCRVVFISTTEESTFNGFFSWEHMNSCVSLCPVKEVQQGLIEIIEVKRGIMCQTNNIGIQTPTLSPAEVY